MLTRLLVAFVLIVLATTAASAREPVVIKTEPSTGKDQSRIVSDPTMRPAKASESVATETR